MVRPIRCVFIFFYSPRKRVCARVSDIRGVYIFETRSMFFVFRPVQIGETYTTVTISCPATPLNPYCTLFVTTSPVYFQSVRFAVTLCFDGRRAITPQENHKRINTTHLCNVPATTNYERLYYNIMYAAVKSPDSYRRVSTKCGFPGS